jgi:hypothetical protein
VAKWKRLILKILSDVMVQRIQTLILALNDVVFFALFFVPFMSLSDGKGPLFAVSYTIVDVIPALIAESIIAVLATFVIVQYRNRRFQLKLCAIGAVLSLLNTSGLVLMTMLNNSNVTTGGAQYNVELGTYLSLGHFVLFVLARIFIKRDEDLVSSVDRIR